MSRNVCIVSGKGGKYKYVRVCESYRNAEGKPRSRTIENHGSLDELLKKDPLYVEKLRERVAKENAAAKSALLGGLESSAQERIRRLETAAAGGPDYGHVKKLGLGSALLRQVWKEDLNLPQLFRYLQSKTKIEYSYEKAAFLLCAGRILNPGSKKRTFARKDRSIVPYDELSDINAVYRVLDRLAADPAFGLTRPELEALMDPRRYIGRCPQQVARFLERCQPLLAQAQTADGAITL